jgi:hypothetical protein
MTERDGYYAMSAICIAVGIALLVTFVLPTARRLQRELLSATCIYTAVTGLDDFAFRIADVCLEGEDSTIKCSNPAQRLHQHTHNVAYISRGFCKRSMHYSLTRGLEPRSSRLPRRDMR